MVLFLCLFICPSVSLLVTQDLRIELSVFLILIFFKLNKVRKVARLDFWKNVPLVQESPKNSKIAPQSGFWGFDKNLIHVYVLFILYYESTSSLLTFCENHMPGKNFVLEYRPKNLHTNQNEGFLKLQYLAMEFVVCRRFEHPPLVDTPSSTLYGCPPLFIFFSKSPAFDNTWQYCPNELLDKLEKKLTWQSYVVVLEE